MVYTTVSGTYYNELNMDKLADSSLRIMVFEERVEMGFIFNLGEYNIGEFNTNNFF